MTEFDISICKEVNKNVFMTEVLGTVEAESSEEITELINFIKAGIEAYEDWKVNGD